MAYKVLFPSGWYVVAPAVATMLVSAVVVPHP